MNAHQTLDKVREGLDLSFMEITQALFETGDLVDKSDKYWLQRSICNLLEKSPEGLTSYKVARAIGINPDVARKSMFRNKRVYIHSWVHSRSGRPAAIYKCVLEGVKAPKDAEMMTDSQDRDERLKARGYVPQGLTKWVVLQ
jgi:hypothetical protein